MNTASLRSRIILHLARYRRDELDNQYGAPYELTQDGIGIALGITRAYASLVLGRMEKTNTVQRTLSPVRNAANHGNRYIYRLTNQGLMEHKEIMRQLEAEGLDPEKVVMVDMNHCSTDVIMSLPEEQLDIVGAVCLIRIPVNRKELPEGSPRIIPVDIHANVYLKDDTRNRVLARATPEQVRRFHSLAADWCTDRDKEVQERLYHLTGAHRFREAAKLALSSRYELMEECDEGLVATLTELCDNSRDPELGEMTAHMAIMLGLPAEARRAVESSDGMDDCVRDSILSEVNLDEGHLDLAMSLAVDSYRGDGMTGIPLGRCMMAEGRYREARIFLTEAMRSIVESGCLFDLERVLALKAETAARMGLDDEAAYLLEMTECVMKRKSTGADLDRIRGILEGPRVRSEYGV